MYIIQRTFATVVSHCEMRSKLTGVDPSKRSRAQNTLRRASAQTALANLFGQRRRHDEKHEMRARESLPRCCARFAGCENAYFRIYVVTTYGRVFGAAIERGAARTEKNNVAHKRAFGRRCAKQTHSHTHYIEHSSTADDRRQRRCSPALVASQW